MICNSPDTQVCKQCHSSSYCSLKCQKTDWPCHKLLCPQFTAMTQRPTPHHKRGIYFGQDAATPTLVWIEYNLIQEDDEYPGYELPNLEQLDPRLVDLTQTRAYKNFVRGRELECPIELFMRDSFLSDGSLPNKSARAATKGLMSHDWCGPLAAVKYTNKTDLFEGAGRYTDMDMRDYRDIVDFLMYYTNEKAWSKYWTAEGPLPKTPRR